MHMQVPEVRNHFADQLAQPPLKFANSRSTTFACVDARGDGAELVSTASTTVHDLQVEASSNPSVKQPKQQA
jgi:hypothetical protein